MRATHFPIGDPSLKTKRIWASSDSMARFVCGMWTTSPLLPTRLHQSFLPYVCACGLHAAVPRTGANPPCRLKGTPRGGTCRLWHCWLEQPVTPWILDMGFQWFANCAGFMTPDNAASLLQGRMTTVDPAHVSLAAWHCFLRFFREVGGTCAGLDECRPGSPVAMCLLCAALHEARRATAVAACSF